MIDHIDHFTFSFSKRFHNCSGIRLRDIHLYAFKWFTFYPIHFFDDDLWFELQLSKPQVIIKEVDGVKCEPFERVQVDVPEAYTGAVMESLGERKGEMIDMVNHGDRSEERRVG